MFEKHVNFSVSQYEDVWVVTLHEKRLDSSIAPLFKAELLKIILSGVKKLLINLKKVDSIDSSGLGTLTFSLRQLEEVNGQVAVCCLKRKVLTLFQIAKLDRVIPVYKTEKEGLK